MQYCCSFITAILIAVISICRKATKQRTYMFTLQATSIARSEMLLVPKAHEK